LPASTSTESVSISLISLISSIDLIDYGQGIFQFSFPAPLTGV
jgi:hypothetical protein